MNTRLLTFELTSDSSELHIHGDGSGLRELVRVLERAIATREHDHLKTPSWGGTELTEQLQGQETSLIHSVVVHPW